MPTGYHVHANGIRQHLIRYPGAGRPLLLLPGITSPAITWGFAAERLMALTCACWTCAAGASARRATSTTARRHGRRRDCAGRFARTPGGAGTFDGARIATSARAQPRMPSASSWSIHPCRGRADGHTRPVGLVRRLDPPGAGGLWHRTDAHLLPDLDRRANRAACWWLHTCQWSAIRQAWDGFATDDIHADLPLITLPVRLVVAAAQVVLPDDEAEVIRLMPHIEVRRVAGRATMIPGTTSRVSSLPSSISGPTDLRRTP